MATLDEMQRSAWVLPVEGNPAASVTEAMRFVRRIEASYDKPDAVSRLRNSWVGKIYINYLKRYAAVCWAVRTVFRYGYPVYLNYFSSLSTLLTNKKGRRWRKLVKVSDFVTTSASQTYKLANASVVQTPVPDVFPAGDRIHLESPSDHYTFPEVIVATVQNALVYGGTNLILAGEQVICHDLYDFKRDYTSEELHGRTYIDPESDRIRWQVNDDAPEPLPVAAAFVDACALNYAHWLTEVLPRICLFCADERFRGVPIIVNDGMHPNIMESLFLVTGPQREIITLPIGRALSVSRLYLTTVTGYVPFDRRTNKLPGHSHGVFSRDALIALRDQLGNSTSEWPTQNFPKKIYLRRNSGVRRVVNAGEIERILAGRGYAIVEPEKLTFSQQVALFSNAEIIVAATGAACANLVFCSPATQVVVMMAKHENMPHRYWLNMAAPLGVKVSYVLGEMVHEFAQGIHGNFNASPEDILDAVRRVEGREKIHPTSYVSPKAKLGNDVEVGAFSIIHDNVIVGDRVKVAAYCELGVSTQLGDGSPLTIGNSSLIRSHSVFYESSSFADGLVTGHHVVVRENTKAGIAFQIGTASEIQGDCEIGDYVRFQSNVFVGKKTKIGNYVWVLPYVVLTNDPTPPSNQLIGCVIEDFACLSAASVILPGVTVGRQALVAAGACVTRDVPPQKVVAGVPARIMGEAKSITRRDGSGESAYPWTRHFHRGYPEAEVAKWVAESKFAKNEGET